MKKKKSKKTSLKDKIDQLMQKKYVAENPYCLVCGDLTNCMHHYIPKSLSKALRHVPKNLIPVCESCHFKIHFQDDPEPNNKIIEKKGIEWKNDLEARRREPFKETIGHLEDIIEKYK